MQFQVGDQLAPGSGRGRLALDLSPGIGKIDRDRLDKRHYFRSELDAARRLALSQQRQLTHDVVYVRLGRKQQFGRNRPEADGVGPGARLDFGPRRQQRLDVDFRLRSLLGPGPVTAELGPDHFAAAGGEPHPPPGGKRRHHRQASSGHGFGVLAGDNRRCPPGVLDLHPHPTVEEHPDGDGRLAVQGRVRDQFAHHQLGVGGHLWVYPGKSRTDQPTSVWNSVRLGPHYQLGSCADAAHP